MLKCHVISLSPELPLDKDGKPLRRNNHLTIRTVSRRIHQLAQYDSHHMVSVEKRLCHTCFSCCFMSHGCAHRHCLSIRFHLPSHSTCLLASSGKMLVSCSEPFRNLLKHAQAKDIWKKIFSRLPKQTLHSHPACVRMSDWCSCSSPHRSGETQPS